MAEGAGVLWESGGKRGVVKHRAGSWRRARAGATVDAAVPLRLRELSHKWQNPKLCRKHACPECPVNCREEAALRVSRRDAPSYLGQGDHDPYL